MSLARKEKPQQATPQYPIYSWRAQSPETRLIYIRNAVQADIELSVPLTSPLGFDLEWKPIFVKGHRENPVAVVQLASADRVLLFQVTAMDTFPQKLREVLENPSIVKAGVSIQNDCKKLWNDYGVNVSHCVELGLLARTVDNPHWKGKYTQSVGLARLCETYFEQSLPKGKVQRSNWEAVLSDVQQHYAANDCHSGWALYILLMSKMPNMRPLPLPSFYSFDMVNGTAFQPFSPLFPTAQRTLWQAFNPFYDPGPLPEKSPRPESLQTPGSSGSDGISTPTLSSGPHAGPTPYARDNRKPRHRLYRDGGQRLEGSRGRRGLGSDNHVQPH